MARKLTDISMAGTSKKDNSAAIQKSIDEGIERQRQLAEQARQQRIREYKTFINNISNVSQDVVECYIELQQLEKKVGEQLSGTGAAKILGEIQALCNTCETTLNELNTAGSTAAGKINADGEPYYQYSRTKIPSDTTNKNNNTQTFSYNTATLQEEILPALEKIYGKLGTSSNRLSGMQIPTGCEGTQQASDNISNARTKTRETYDLVVAFCNGVNKAEEENTNIITKVGNWFKGLFGKNKPLCLSEYNYPTNNSTLLTKQADNLAVESLGKKYNIDISGKDKSQVVNESAIKKVAQDNGIDTEGKPIYDIALELANLANMEVSETVKTIKKVSQPTTTTKEIPRTFEGFAEFTKETKGQDGNLQNEDLLKGRDYNFDGKYYWGEAFKSVTALEEGKLAQDLSNGKQIVWRNEGATKFSNTGNYFILTGYSDGKVTVENPNDNTTQEVDLSKLASYGGAFYAYSLKEPKTETVPTTTVVEEVITTEKLLDEETLIKEVLEEYGIQYASGRYTFGKLDLPKIKDTAENDLPLLIETVPEEEEIEEIKPIEDLGNFGTGITYTTEEVPFGGSTAQMLVPSTSDDGTMKTLRLVLAGGDEQARTSDVVNMRNAVWKATQEGDVTFDGYTLVVSCYSNADNVMKMIQEIAKTYNIDVENIEMPAFSLGASHGVALADAINKADNNIHVSQLDYISGGGADPSKLQELANDPTVTINAYYGTGDLDSTKQNVKNIFANYDNITITEIAGGHDTSDNGIVAEFFKNYASGKQKLTLGDTETETTTNNKPTTDSPYLTDQGTYHFYQQNYDAHGANITYGSSKMNCGPTSLCMVISNRLGIEFPPSALRYLWDNYGEGHKPESNGDTIFKEDEVLSLVGLKCEGSVWGRS